MKFYTHLVRVNIHLLLNVTIRWNGVVLQELIIINRWHLSTI